MLGAVLISLCAVQRPAGVELHAGLSDGRVYRLNEVEGENVWVELPRVPGVEVFVPDGGTATGAEPAAPLSLVDDAQPITQAADGQPAASAETDAEKPADGAGDGEGDLGADQNAAM